MRFYRVWSIKESFKFLCEIIVLSLVGLSEKLEGREKLGSRN